MTKSILIALGGNALSPKEEAGTIYQQFAHTRESVDNIMHFVQLGYNICLTHGNGPQVVMSFIAWSLPMKQFRLYP